MDLGKQSPHHLPTTEWYAGDDETDSWISYLHRNFHHIEGETAPFPGSGWQNHEDDLSLHDNVLAALYESPQVDASYIKVLVVKRTVFLEGTVFSDEELRVSEDVARSVDGVWYVENRLVSEHGPRSPDRAL